MIIKVCEVSTEHNIYALIRETQRLARDTMYEYMKGIQSNDLRDLYVALHARNTILELTLEHDGVLHYDNSMFNFAAQALIAEVYPKTKYYWAVAIEPIKSALEIMEPEVKEISVPLLQVLLE